MPIKANESKSTTQIEAPRMVFTMSPARLFETATQKLVDIYETIQDIFAIHTELPEEKKIATLSKTLGLISNLFQTFIMVYAQTYAISWGMKAMGYKMPVGLPERFSKVQQVCQQHFAKATASLFGGHTFSFEFPRFTQVTEAKARM